MAVLSLEESAPLPKDTFLVADTSFVLKVLQPPAEKAAVVGDVKSAQEFFKRNEGRVTYIVNITVMQELLKRLRETFLLKALIDAVGKEKAERMFKDTRGDIPKHREAKKYWAVLRGAIVDLDQVIADYEAVFWHAEGKLKAGKLRLSDAIQLMRTYLLNSSDALILNYALKMGDIRGLVSCDSDFSRVTEEKASDGLPFDVYLPKRLISA